MDASPRKLSLYHYDGCGYCRIVRARAEQLGIDLELRNIYQFPNHLDDLLHARGRQTVPVLRIETDDGRERWLPESRDIIRYLHELKGEPLAAPRWLDLAVARSRYVVWGLLIGSFFVAQPTLRYVLLGAALLLMVGRMVFATKA